MRRLDAFQPVGRRCTLSFVISQGRTACAPAKQKGLGALTTNLDDDEIFADEPAYCSGGLVFVGAEPSVVSRITPDSST